MVLQLLGPFEVFGLSPIALRSLPPPGRFVQPSIAILGLQVQVHWKLVS